jgi:hypothetical protein
MRITVLVLLVAANLMALYFGVSRFFVTFVDYPGVDGPLPPGCGHFYNLGVEEMRTFLGPSLKWLVGLVALNFCVATVALIRGRRSRI